MVLYLHQINNAKYLESHNKPMSSLMGVNPNLGAPLRICRWSADIYYKLFNQLKVELLY